MKSKVIDILFSNRDGYISGEQISDELGITRAAVWKVINTIKKEGGAIDAVSGRGYKLISLPDLLKPEYLKYYSDKEIGNIKWFEEIDSTNNYLKDLARKKIAEPEIAIAESQTGGKGRLGRKWTSRPGDSIQMSFLIKPDASPALANAYNFAGTLGICKAVQQLTGVDLKIKWPNDIVSADRKICGILTEMSTDMNEIEYIVFGAGLNVNQDGFSGELKDKAISLKMITGKTIDRKALCALEIKCVLDYFNLADNGKVDEIMAEYKNKSAILNKRVYLISANEKIKGVCENFGSEGELLLNIDGEIKPFHAGEISVRGEQGYV